MQPLNCHISRLNGAIHPRFYPRMWGFGKNVCHWGGLVNVGAFVCPIEAGDHPHWRVIKMIGDTYLRIRKSTIRGEYALICEPIEGLENLMRVILRFEYPLRLLFHNFLHLFFLMRLNSLVPVRLLADADSCFGYDLVETRNSNLRAVSQIETLLPLSRHLRNPNCEFKIAEIETSGKIFLLGKVGCNRTLVKKRTETWNTPS